MQNTNDPILQTPNSEMSQWDGCDLSIKAEMENGNCFPKRWIVAPRMAQVRPSIDSGGAYNYLDARVQNVFLGTL